MKKYLFMLCAAATVVNAAEYFCSPSGNDAASGSRTAPWKTPAAAVNRVKKGDIITLLPGTYPAGIKMNVSGVTLRGVRGKNGEWLSIINDGHTLKNWRKEPGIADNMWSAPLKAAPGCITLNGKQVILLGQRLMRLTPKKMKVDLLIGEHYAFGKGNRKQRTEKMIPGLDLMALPKGIKIRSGQFRPKKEVDLWKYCNYIMAGWRGGRLYIRMLNGKTPEDYVIRYGGNLPGITIDGQRENVIADLHIHTVKNGISISGEPAVKNCIRNCRIEHGNGRITVTKGAGQTHIHDNELTLGMFNCANNSSRDWYANRFTYVAFKYLVSNRQVSDDHSLNFDYSGSGNLVENNIVYQGLSGTSTAFSKGVTIRNNVFREQSSCGVVCSMGSTMDVYGNVFIDNGINLRFHSFHGAKQGRLARVYDNFFRMHNNYGMQLFILCLQRNLDSDEKIWVYHNTFSGSSFLVSTRNFERTYKGSIQNINFLNNLVIDAPGARFPYYRIASGNALPAQWREKKFPGKNNFIWEKISGEAPFFMMEKLPAGAEKKFVSLQRAATINGIAVPPLPGMENHPALPGAIIRDKRIVELVRRSEELSRQAIKETKGFITK